MMLDGIKIGNTVDDLVRAPSDLVIDARDVDAEDADAGQDGTSQQE
jgi:hypothetical protein